MGKDKEHIMDQLFAQHLAESEAPVRDSVWEGIAAEMENDRLRKKVIWARLTAAASVLLLIGFGAWYWWGNGFDRTGAPRFSQGEILSLPQVDSNGSGTVSLGSNLASSRHTTAQPRLKFSSSQRAGLLANQAVRPGSNRMAQKQLNSMFVDQFGSNVNPSWTPPTEAKQEIPMVRQTSMVDQIVPREATLFGQDQLQLIPQQRNGSAKEAAPTPETTTNTYTVNDFNFDREEKEAESQKMDRWALGGNFSPDYTFSGQMPIQNSQTLASTGTSREFIDPVVAQQEPTEIVTAYTTGLNLGYDVSNRIGIQSGVFYQNRSSQSAGSVNTFGKIEPYSSDFNLNMVEIPVLVKVDLVEKDKFSYYVTSGISANLLWGYDNTLSNSEGQVTARLTSLDDRKFQPAQGNILVRTGVRYQVLDKLSLNLEPGLRYGVLSNRYAFAGDNPMQISLNTGMNFHF